MRAKTNGSKKTDSPAKMRRMILKMEALLLDEVEILMQL